MIIDNGFTNNNFYFMGVSDLTSLLISNENFIVFITKYRFEKGIVVSNSNITSAEINVNLDISMESLEDNTNHNIDEAVEKQSKL